MKKIIIPVIATAAITSVLTFWGFSKLSHNPDFHFGKGEVPVRYVSDNGTIGTQPVDFAPAAQSSVKSVVHIRTLTEGKTVIANDPNDPFSNFFGPRAYNIPDQMAAGSGVIISPDGYIVTNNHVVAGADKVEVTFNTRNQQIAKVVGTDPSTDLAVLKIDGKNLPYMTMGNSDQVQVGQWVLAVGYPLNLDATVTAGIVSAKARDIGINRKRNNSAIESFIQTDAAVNPGNSGGALVNTNGQLIGINSAIASPTGSYAGYSYAIPSNLVQKVVNDIIKFGSVKRGYLGIMLADLNNMDKETAKKQFGMSESEFDNAKGVYVAGVDKSSGAATAGIRKGDFITAINGMNVNSSPELMEQVARFHPGDKITLGYNRDGTPYNATVELKASMSNAIASIDGNTLNFMGASVRNLSKSEMDQYGLQGVMISNVGDGDIAHSTQIKKGFIITVLNGQSVSNITDLQNALNSNGNKNIELGGTYPGQNGMYYYGFNSSGDNNNY